MLSKQRRLSGREVKNIIKKGTAKQLNSLFVRLLPARGLTSKFAVVVSKKISNKATTRNKIKRQIYSILREADLAGQGVCAVFFVKTETEFEDYKKEVSLWLKNWRSH